MGTGKAVNIVSSCGLDQETGNYIAYTEQLTEKIVMCHKTGVSVESLVSAIY